MDGWESYLKRERHWVEGRETVFIFDEAQTSYTDGALWTDFFRCMRDSEYHNRRAVVFVSYGSASSTIFIQGTPIFIADEARIGMLPVAHDDLPPVYSGGDSLQMGISKRQPPLVFFHPSFVHRYGFC
jgi:hypothetical protein